MTSSNRLVRSLKDGIIHAYCEIFGDYPLKPNVKNAFYKYGRHQFVQRFRFERSEDWIHINEENLSEHLNTIYRDSYLITDGKNDNHITSSISQPSLVLLMLNILPLKLGARVLEIGAGSGWNAAMLGDIVGKTGIVDSIEIDPVVAKRALYNLSQTSLNNVNIVVGDGADSVSVDESYDAVVFTVGTYDLTPEIMSSVKEGGHLLVVLKNMGGGDVLYLLHKREGTFHSLESLPCGFVQMQGRLRLKEMEPIFVEESGELRQLVNNPTKVRDFWFGGKNPKGFFWRAGAFRSYLSATHTKYFVFALTKNVEINSEEVCFGIYLKREKSLAYFYKERLYSCGAITATNAMDTALNQWLLGGMPSLASFHLTIVPSNSATPLKGGKFVVRNRYADYHYS